MDEDLDRELRARFAQGRRRIAPEPFLSNARRRIEAVRLRRVLLLRAAQLLAIVLCLLFSPWIVQAAAWLSAQLGLLFAFAERWMNHTAGMIVIAALAVSVLVWKRRELL